MADTKQTKAGSGGPGSETTSTEPAPVLKVTRAKATTSDVPPRTTRPKAQPDDTPGLAATAHPGGTAESGAPKPKAASPASPTERPASVGITQGGAAMVEGDTVGITQGGVTTVNARSVQVHQGGIVSAEADDINVNMGGIVLARADRISVEMGGLGVSFAREAHLTQGAARSVIAQNVHVDQGLIGTALAGRVTFERPAGVLLLLAGRVDGPVRAMFDWRGALAFGAAFGLLVGLLRRR